MPTRHPTLAADDGSSTTELAVLMPVVLTIVLLVVQTGLYLHARQVVEAAAQEGLEAAQVQIAAPDSGAQAAARRFLDAAGGVRSPQIQVERDATRVVVQVRATAPNVLPAMSWSVSSSVTGELERFVPATAR